MSSSNQSGALTADELAKVPEKQQHLYHHEEHAVEHHDEQQQQQQQQPASSVAPAGQGATPSRVILLPIDRSNHSAVTLRWAKRHFLQDGDQVVLVNVRPYQQVYLTDLGGDVLSAVESMEAAARHASHELIRSFGRHLMSPTNDDGTPAPKVVIKGFAIRGDARADILRKARELHVDAIVMGSRGLGTLKRALLGSVSDYIVHQSPCPVVVVRETAYNVKHHEGGSSDPLQVQ